MSGDARIAQGGGSTTEPARTLDDVTVLPDEEKQPTTAAHFLVGTVLDGGWRLTERIDRPPGGRMERTGGFFSVCYRAKNENGDEAFVKVLDFEAIFKDRNVPLTKMLEIVATVFNFEVSICEVVVQRRLSRVVRALANGETVGCAPGGDEQRLNYLIFEAADDDVRGVLDAFGDLDTAWKIRMLHDAAAGINQLHGQNIAHQDLKPSNVLVFERDAAKVADFGSASVRGRTAPQDPAPVAGDYGYAPPELLYGEVSSDWARRRRACDLYHVGSLALFLFTGQGTTSQVMRRLAPEHQWTSWGDTYQDVLPHVMAAYSEVMDEFAAAVPANVRDKLVARVRELCHPDPALRGHPRNRIGHSDPYSLARYVTEFDVLAKEAAMPPRPGVV